MFAATVPTLLVLPLLVAPWLLLGWLALTWPGEIAETRLQRFADGATERGDVDSAARAERVAASFGVCRTKRRLFDSTALLAFASLRRCRAAASPVQPDSTARQLAGVWCCASIGLAAWSGFVGITSALRSPSLVASPGRWRAVTRERIAAVFAAHEAVAVEYGEHLVRLDEQIPAQLQRW